MTLDDLMADKTQFSDVSGRNFWFVRFMEKGTPSLVSWKKNDGQSMNLIAVPVVKVSKDTLVNLGVWNSLSTDTQSLVERFARPIMPVERPMVVSPMNHPATPTGKRGRGRPPSPDLIGIPKIITCKCGREVHVNPRQVIAKAQEDGKSVGDWVADFKCRSCRKG